MGDKPEDPTDWAPGQPPPTLASRGYEYVPGPTGDRSDWVLRKIADGTPFAFESQQKYDAVGAAVGVWLKERLVSLCGLEPLADVVPPATLYAIQIHFPLPQRPKARVPPGTDVVPS